MNQVVTTTPTIGSNVEEVEYKNLKFVMWVRFERTTNLAIVIKKSVFFLQTGYWRSRIIT